ncbi:MAG: sel1 repeat family protein [Alloprevotella sp.]|nr:sel1 repeat family protein [Alloprevotella sp.]MBR1653013.1 sel1 repeat family protein [Alloprevotella sp.]
MFIYGRSFYHGHGISKNYEEAAEQGNANAQYNLGQCFYYGQGISRNRKEGVKWMKRAAGNGSEDAREFLKGIGK